MIIEYRHILQATKSQAIVWLVLERYISLIFFAVRALLALKEYVKMTFYAYSRFSLHPS